MPGFACKKRECKSSVQKCVYPMAPRNRSFSIAHNTYLSTALDNIKGADGHVCKTAGKNASDHALGVVAHIVYVTHLLCSSYLV